jgi:hypothetical protein
MWRWLDPVMEVVPAIVPPPGVPPSPMCDPRDEQLWNAALNAGTAYAVSHNTRHFLSPTPARSMVNAYPGIWSTMSRSLKTSSALARRRSTARPPRPVAPSAAGGRSHDVIDGSMRGACRGAQLSALGAKGESGEVAHLVTQVPCPTTGAHRQRHYRSIGTGRHCGRRYRCHGREGSGNAPTLGEAEVGPEIHHHYDPVQVWCIWCLRHLLHL